MTDRYSGQEHHYDADPMNDIHQIDKTTHPFDGAVQAS
jgi:hypothetical protein